MDQDASSADEYYSSAQQFFYNCGAGVAATLRVDVIMRKLSTMVRNNTSELSFLRALIDPDDDNPEIRFTRLANAMRTHSERHQMVQREKRRLELQLRSQIPAARECMQIAINMYYKLREAREKLYSSEQELENLKKELETNQRNTTVMREQLLSLENEKLTQQEQLVKSKREFIRIREMYAERLSALLVQNESLTAERAVQAARLQNRGNFMQQIMKEKVMLETQLQELLNKSNQHMDRSTDVSYTEDEMLNGIGTLNTSSSFAPELLSVPTQTEVPSNECVQRKKAKSHRLRTYLWGPLMCFLLIAFVYAVAVVCRLEA